MIIAGAIAGVYLLLLVGVTLNQRQMMYFPSKAPLAQLEPAARSYRFESWNNPAGQHIGWKRSSPTQPAVGQILILHGNAGHALLWSDHAEALQTHKALDVYILEYPGYGARPGKPTQKSILAAASEALALLNTNPPTYLLAESLGTGVAAYLAGTSPSRIAGVMLIAPYNRMSAVAQHHMRIFPVRWVLWDQYPAEDYLKKYSGPVACLVGGRDRVIPKHYGERLFTGYAGPKMMRDIPEASHDDLHRCALDWMKEALEFFQGKAQGNFSASPDKK